ncbi:8-oxoguanine glycosylase ogg1 [Gnomoniopsis smithogilvyi]|uniref:DNA-(apurinic or apyrimidinic site) lyase n=1 Tax=Gnomoniopsis smithogilvyi TaxID=1191159 RepID=A0A9W9D1U7_9PEZI|nr:8-oxoguanine glycosylase ogg1 [Gnomoniopsis smithogilvyi]
MVFEQARIFLCRYLGLISTSHYTHSQVMASRTPEWRKLPLNLTELCIDTTLRCGQSFRWRMISDEWHCALHGRIISLRQDPEYLHYRATWPKALVAPLTPPTSTSASVIAPPPGENTPEDQSADDTEALLVSYFNLSHSLTTLYAHWSSVDANFRKRAPGFTGVRILNQDAWEALVGFICSSNNNISRISQMVHKLCVHYGAYIGAIGDQPMHDFPTPMALTAPGVEAHLRELGFGYRAKYIARTAQDISQNRPIGWLQSLRNPASVAWKGAASAANCIEKQSSYKHAHEQLLQLTGVGPKVADCVCLMGLGWGEAVPVDTHVWQIAMRDYKFGGKSKNKTLTKAMYDAVGDHFRKLWGDQAGWAHSVLFTADLRTFADRVMGKSEGGAEIQAVKVEMMEVSALGTPVSTPVATPLKRRRSVKKETEALNANFGDAPVSISGARVTRKRQRTHM